MDKIVQLLKRQQEINFKNIRDQIKTADLETVFDNENNSRYIFHYLHSMDRFFMKPNDYIYEGEKLFGIDENLSVIDSKRAGYIGDTSIVIPREKLFEYLDYMEAKINSYFETLTAENLLEVP